MHLQSCADPLHPPTRFRLTLHTLPSFASGPALGPAVSRCTRCCLAMGVNSEPTRRFVSPVKMLGRPQTCTLYGVFFEITVPRNVGAM